MAEIMQETVEAFKSGNKQVAEKLLPSLRPAEVRTKFRSFTFCDEVMVSLLHLAAYWGWKDIATCLVTVHKCVANWRDTTGHIPLHYAAYNGHLEVVKYFITELLCDPMDRSRYYDKIPLHFACANGHLNIVQYLISELHCDPSCVDSVADTPLHIACHNGHLNIVRYLISKARCDPLCVNHLGCTPLHHAIFSHHAHIVHYMLSTRCVDPLVEKMCFSVLSCSSCKSVTKLLQPFIFCSRYYPVHTFTKLILIGDSGAGKTTTGKHIICVARIRTSGSAINSVSDIQCLTEGSIIETNFGNFILYDFAGQQEYYPSHAAAILEQVMCKSAAMFFCVIDLSKSKESICQSLQYWLTFINNACSTGKGRSHVAIVGSHADLAQSLEEKSSLVQEIAASKVKHQEYAGYIEMDCRKVGTTSHKLISMLTDSQKAITAIQPNISIYCHVLYAFLQRKLSEEVGYTLQQLATVINSEINSPLPSDPLLLAELLTTLSDKGLILFINHPKSCWVVANAKVLLNKINGTLLAPHHFKDLASNTGIVPTSNLHMVFPRYNLEMLIGFLESLNFCLQVDHSVLQYTNLKNTTTSPSYSTADTDCTLLFFPSLVELDRPDSFIQQGTLQFGWCLGCMDDHQFFSSRFLHVLLLSVAYQFPLACQSSTYKRMCTIWKNGISWRNDDDITAVVELLDNKRQVLVAISYSEEYLVKFAELRYSLITLVRLVMQQHCSCVEACDFLISPEYVRQYPINILPENALFDIHDVARSILCRKPVVLSKDGQGRLTTESLHFEPYHLLTAAHVCQLFNPSLSDQPVPDSLLHKVQKICHLSKMKSQVHKELREYLNNLSFFVGRNPLVVAELKEEDLLSDTCSPTPTGTGDPSSILSIDDLFEVLMFVKQVINWKNLGLALGLVYPTLQKIEKDQRDRVDDCMREMLAAWLQQQDNVTKKGFPSWIVLQTALRKIGENQLADSINY